MDAVIKQWPKTVTDHVHNAPAPVDNKPSREEAEAAVRALIAYLGEDPAREGLVARPSASSRRWTSFIAAIGTFRPTRSPALSARPSPMTTSC